MTKTYAHTQFNLALLGAVLVALCATTIAPMNAHAQGRPDVTGQERAASVSNRGSSNDESTQGQSNRNESVEVEGEEDEEKSGAPRGLERAAAAGNKPEEIRNQLQYILLLITQLQDAADGRGIGRELSEYIQNGRLPLDGGGDDDTDASVLVASLISSTETLIDNTEASDDDEGEFVIELSITASSGDLMIPMTAGVDGATTTGVVFSVRNSSTTEVASGTVSAVVESTAGTSTNSFVVNQGETETFTVTVTFDPDESDEYYVQLEAVNTDQGVQTLSPVADFQSADLVI